MLILPGLLCLALLLACPKKQESVSWREAESGLRLAINMNEVAYGNWNKVYENIGGLHRSGKVSKSQWEQASTLDGVIVLAEADLIEGIEKSKKLLTAWKQATTKALTAENVTMVEQLRQQEVEARRTFDSSIDELNLRSFRLRGTYGEAMELASSLIREGNSLPAEPIIAIRQILTMVDNTISRQNLRDTAWPAPDQFSYQQPQTTAVRPRRVSQE